MSTINQKPTSLEKYKHKPYNKYCDPLWIKWKLWLGRHPLEPFPHLHEHIPLIKIAFLLNYEVDTVQQYIYRGKIKSTKSEKGTGSGKFLVSAEDFIDYLTTQDRKNRLYDFTTHKSQGIKQ